MMHSSLMRMNATLSYGISIVGMMTIVCIFSTYLMSGQSPVVTLNVWDPFVHRSRSYHAGHNLLDRGQFTFSLTTDLSPIMHWNTKQLFLYVVAEYQTSEEDVNQVVVWDKIVTRNVDSHTIDERNIQLKYPFYDEGNGLRDNNVTLSLHWNHVPLVGGLSRHNTGHIVFEFPNYYTTRF
eukprot:m.241023 g.241023  ORF g.241023 m.241023 type:complete len:180 (-) comp17238_c0_seq1:132-671(-)